MNKRQKQVVQKQLSEEEQELKWLESIYRQAAKDCADRIAELEGRTDLENMQSIIYQKQYQEFLQKQIESTLEDLQKNAYKGISDYLEQCYQTGFIGTQFDLMGQGVPFTFPIDLKAVKRAIETDSKLSKGLYARLGEDTEYLKKAVKAEISRGIVEGKSWSAVADKLAQHMEQTPFQKAKNNSMRIVRTEGGRIQGQSQLDACREAKEKGADVVKQWDSTLDSRTRETHIELDGQIVEVEEYFVIPSSGKRSLTKGGFNDPAEDCNCRCCVLQRAKWALDGKMTKMDNFTKEIREFESPADYEQFKKSFFSDENKTFMKYVDKLENKYDTKDFEKLLDMMSDREYDKYKELFLKNPMYGNSEKVKIIDGQKVVDNSIDSLRDRLKELEKQMEKATTLDEMIRIQNEQDEITNKVRRIEAEEEKKKVSATTKKLKKTLGDDYDSYVALIERTDEMKVLYRYADGVSEVAVDPKGYYSPGDKSVYYSLRVKKGMNKYGTLAHEYGHYFDDVVNSSNVTFEEVRAIGSAMWGKKGFEEVLSSSDQFLSAMRKDKRSLAKIGFTKLREELKDANASCGVQDAIDGMGFGRIVWGHGDKYYNRKGHRVKDKAELKKVYVSLGFPITNQTQAMRKVRDYETTSEMWANITSAITVGGEELEYIKKYLPESYKMYLEILKGVV